MDEYKAGDASIGVVIISREEYKELLRSQVLIEMLRDAVQKEKYFNRDDAARYLHMEIEKDEK